MLKQTFVCPFCFDECKISDLEFRCTNRRCEDVPDVPMTKYLNGDISNPMTGKPTFRAEVKGFSAPDGAICKKCQSKTYAIVCPSCHNKLPKSTIQGKDMIISVVGSRSAGKSHFVAVIINELLKRISVNFGGSLEGFDDTYKRYINGPFQSLYMDLMKLDLTKSSVYDVDNGAYKPFIFTLKLPPKGFFKKGVDTFTLVFFDTAGEDLNDEDTMSTVNKYICKSSGIIFLLDPMHFPSISAQLDDEIVKSASSVDWKLATRSDDIMTRVSNLIRNDKKMSDGTKINIPVAAVLSKFDAITSIIPPGSIVLNDSPHCTLKKFDEDDRRSVDGEIQSLLTGVGEGAFISQVDMNYTNYSFFGVSALGMGNTPKENWKIEKPHPHRIEDPLLWILKENDVIKSK